eukprot:GFYU01008109.1.p1 GENE.GFYU01008109.1~~GFYU01008109.1.p1  ORF type:complete len:534 (-),score=66.04 GFYU01008109.1:71-1672(-)
MADQKLSSASEDDRRMSMATEDSRCSSEDEGYEGGSRGRAHSGSVSVTMFDRDRADRNRSRSNSSDNRGDARAGGGAGMGGLSNVDEQLLSEIEEAELMLQSMPELEFEVIKINQRGRRQNRVLKLSGEGISNIKNRTTVTNHHSFQDVTRVGLSSIDTLTIAYENDHDFVYVSPAAMQIVQEITSRLAIKRGSEKRRLMHEGVAHEFQEKLQLQDGRRGRSFVVSPSSPSSLRRRVSNAKIGESKTSSRRANKLQQITGDTEEQRITVAVDKIVLDRSSPEGRTIAHFVNNFTTLEKNPQTAAGNVRQFIDGMRQYLLEHREAELTKLVVASEGNEEPGVEHEKVNLNDVINCSLERAILLPLEKRILKCIESTLNLEEEVDLMDKMADSAERDQTTFGIPSEHQSLSNYAPAKLEMEDLNRTQLPSEKLRCLLDSAKSIYTTYNEDRNALIEDDAQRKQHFLSADDFLPIHIYVVACASIQHPLLTLEYLWALSDPLVLNGEGGYYLTVFQSAVHFLKDMELPEEQTEGGE